jgi:hypothetical protein
MAGWLDPDHDDDVTDWCESFARAVAPHATGSVYVNTLGVGEEDRVRAAYGVNYERLAELKREWDPDNLFRSNHNIEPVPASSPGDD